MTKEIPDVIKVLELLKREIIPCKEKEMATHSSILAWKIPWTEEPDRLTKNWT